MSESDHCIGSKKAGLSGLFRARMVAAVLLMASATVALAEPLAIEVTDAAPLLEQRTNDPMIAFKMTPASTKLFAEFTTKNVGRKVDIRIDGKTAMSPVIREPILGGSVQVSGGWTLRQAKDLADSIAAGKSKIEVELASE